jgi:hypothetical protein
MHLNARIRLHIQECEAKAEVIRHKHFWGHQEYACVEAEASHADVPQEARIVFLDRDGVINTLPKYNTGWCALHTHTYTPAQRSFATCALYARVRQKDRQTGTGPNSWCWTLSALGTTNLEDRQIDRFP